MNAHVCVRVSKKIYMSVFFKYLLIIKKISAFENLSTSVP
jgi:hypothetical protein